jgi:hypothetical protein
MVTAEVVVELWKVARPPRTVSWKDVVFGDDGAERAWDEIVEAVGVRAAQLACIERAIAEKKLRPPALRVPPRLFLSYRHGSDVREQWVRDLARTLVKRGYIVLFDETQPLPSVGAILDLIAAIASCHYFVSVIDPRYVESVSDIEGESGTRTWAYFEWKIARGMVERFGLACTGFLVEGDKVTRDSVLSDGVLAGTAFSVDTAEKLGNALDQLFPQVVSPKPSLARAADVLVSQSLEASFRGEHEAALMHAREAAAILPKNVDVQYRLALAAFTMSEMELGFRAAHLAAELDPHSTFVRFVHVFAELVVGNLAEARMLASEVSHIFSTSWRFKSLQLGIEVAGGEAYAIVSCGRAVYRMASHVCSWARRWRHTAFGAKHDDMRTFEFPPRQPLPVSGADLGEESIAAILQIDKAVPLKGSGIKWVPELRFRESRDAPDRLFDLNMLLMAYLGAKWLPAAFRNQTWDTLRPHRDSIPKDAATLLLEDGRLIRIAQK